MSHFTVLVIGNNAEEQLAPYNENLEGPFRSEEEQYLKEFETKMIPCVKFANNKIVNKYSETVSPYWTTEIPGNIFSKKVLKLPHRAVELEVTAKELYKDFDIYMKDWHGMNRDKETNQYGTRYNQNSKWDWYVLGGRWTGFFKMKSNSSSKNRKVGRPGLGTGQAKPGRTDSALLKDIDFEAMRNEAGNDAQERYERIERLLGSSIPKLETKWETFIDKDGPFKDVSIEEKRKMYHAQTAKKAVQKASENMEFSDEERRELRWLDLEDFQCTKEEFIQRARNRACSTFAVLKDGKWYEKGKMGWWGMASNEKDQEIWNAEINKLLSNLPEDTILSVYDCHI